MVIDKRPFPQLSLASLVKRYPEGRRRQRMTRMYEMMLAEAEALAEPMTMYGEFSLAQTAALTPWLQKEATAVILAVCTFGSATNKRIHALLEDDMALAAILDEIMLAAMVALTRQLHGDIRMAMQSRHLKAGPAYRPGVGRWPMAAQRTVFAHLPTHEIGVTLNDYLVMMPVHSTSLVIPVLDKQKEAAG